ncbi:MAG TPA: hypothetical protein VFY90_10120 [Tepidiformaceae bacterium]|nr:hypothetical protein [Tepidiformaceae bacterium]
MAEKTVAGKLLIKPHSTVWTSDAARLDLLNPLPDGVRPVDHPAKAATALVFAEDAGAVRQILGDHRQDLGTPAAFWVAYPKANRADINRDTLWPILTEYGMRPIGQVALNDVWSAMRFRMLKEGEAPFTGGVKGAGA